MGSASPSAIEPDPGAGLEAYGAALWRLPGVAEACLELQDRSAVDVSLVLLACWLAARGVALEPETAERLRSLARPWNEQVVTPLREARRALKRLAQEPEAAGSGAPIASLRAAVAHSELEAERIVARLLERASVGLACAAPPGPGTAAVNLEHLIGTAAANSPAAATLLAAAFDV